MVADAKYIGRASSATPLVSICIPTYLGAKFISSTINSVLYQSYTNFEIIIVDDCSPDNTEQIVSQISDSRINYYKNKENLGPEENWNLCIKKAVGKYYKLLPHDDLLIEDCIETQVSILEKDIDEKIALVFGSRYIINSKGKTLLARNPLGRTSRKINKNDLINKCVKSGGNIIGEPGSGLIRTQLANLLRGYDASQEYMIDLDFWFRALLHGDAYYDAKPVSKFRLSKTSWSAAIGKRQSEDFNKFVDRFYSDPRYSISKTSRLIGFFSSKILNSVRRFFFSFLA